MIQELKYILEDEISKYNIANEPYFKSLLNGTMGKETFLQTQEQFSYLVEYYSRPMALVIANIENDITRLKIVENLWEEHGNGDPDKIHGKTILKFIDNLGGNSNLLNNKNIDVVTQTFNNTLKGIAAFEDYRFSVAFFAGIERCFVEVSEAIALAVIKHKWIPEEHIVHYSLHKEIDIQHAKDFLKVVEDEWEDKETKSLVQKGIQQGIYVFLGVYTGYYNKYQKSTNV